MATFWSLFFSYGSMILVLIRNLALVPLYLKYIGIEEYGAWLATGGVLAYLTIADFGLTGLLTQQSAVAYGARDSARLGKTVGIGLGISIALAILAGLVAASLAPFVPDFLGLTGPIAHRLIICFLIAAISDIFNLISYAAAGVLKSFQRTFIPGMLSFLSDVVSIIVTVFLVTHGWGLFAIAIGLAVRGALAMVGNLAACLWICLRTLGLRLTCTWRDTVEFWRLSAYQFAMRVGAVSTSQLDPFLIGVFLGPKTTAAYVLTIRAHEMVRTLAGRFADAIMAPLAHLHGEGRPSRFRDIAMMGVRFQSLLSIIGMVGVVAFNPLFMKIWVGPGVYVGGWTNCLIALWGASYVATGALWQALFAMGLLSPMAKIVWLEVLIKLPLMFVLLYFVGLIGAPVAVVVAHFVAVAVLFVVATREMRLNRQDLWQFVETALRIVAACGVSAVFIRSVFPPPQIWKLFAAQAVTYAALALLLTAAFNLREATMLYRAIASRVLSRLQRPTGSLG